jgi:enamine deaminase RidA (YjgF/YER057c/UK114 family)
MSSGAMREEARPAPCQQTVNETRRTATFPHGRRKLHERKTYSAEVAPGGFLFVSGQVGSEDAGGPAANAARQLRLAFTHLNGVLAAGVALAAISSISRRFEPSANDASRGTTGASLQRGRPAETVVVVTCRRPTGVSLVQPLWRCAQRTG